MPRLTLEETIPVVRKNTYNCTSRVGRKASHCGITNNPKRRHQQHRRVRQTGKLTVNGRAKTRAGYLRVDTVEC